MLIEYHRNMLSDEVRNKAFHAALKKLIVPGKTTVADIGAGTGLLGFMAKKLGAKDVFMYEMASIMGLAQKLAKENKMKGCHFFSGHSTEAFDPPKVDLIVSETLGNYGFEENITATIEDAKRFLNPGGTIIPQRLTHYACPVISDRFHKELSAWDEVGYELDFSSAKEMGLNNVYVRSFKSADLLDGGKAAAVWDSIDFRRKNGNNRRGTVKWKMDKDTVIYGAAVWWHCELIEGIALCTGPLSPKTHWEQLYFPAIKPLALRKGDVVTVEISSTSSYAEGTNLRWVFRARGETLTHDLKKGYLA